MYECLLFENLSLQKYVELRKLCKLIKGNEPNKLKNLNLLSAEIFLITNSND